MRNYEIYYIDPPQADPLPRTARLGYGLSTGIDFKIRSQNKMILDRLLKFPAVNRPNLSPSVDCRNTKMRVTVLVFNLQNRTMIGRFPRHHRSVGWSVGSNENTALQANQRK